MVRVYLQFTSSVFDIPLLLIWLFHLNENGGGAWPLKTIKTWESKVIKKII